MADDHAAKEDRMALTMTRREREAFLAGVHVGIISIAEEGRGPLTVPIWYAYTPGGELRLITGRHSRKGRLLAQAGRFSLCAQTEAPPYRYVVSRDLSRLSRPSTWSVIFALWLIATSARRRAMASSSRPGGLKARTS